MKDTKTAVSYARKRYLLKKKDECNSDYIKRCRKKFERTITLIYFVAYLIETIVIAIIINNMEANYDGVMFFRLTGFFVMLITGSFKLLGESVSNMVSIIAIMNGDVPICNDNDAFSKDGEYIGWHTVMSVVSFSPLAIFVSIISLLFADLSEGAVDSVMYGTNMNGSNNNVLKNYDAVNEMNKELRELVEHLKNELNEKNQSKS